MIELYLSTDGKHTVHVQASDREEMNKMFPFAKALYQKITSTLGTKAQMWDGVINGKKPANGQSYGKRIDTVEQAQDQVAPLCPVHETPMKLRNGEYGEFWSCGRKNPDGSWCREKPDQEFLNF
ncbi:MAG: hypothetical protein A3D92_09400 [Bacteroidetes bacterium RIFCSPHIGHO2_02_FULL_44_7]|nr:MAG: hypothetical protein A3D92_09400 [Bacteroidetes bacterium RIFCSPHIGHO2_02_FULL_44_7]